MDHLDPSCLELRHFRHEDNLRTHDLATGSDVHCGENCNWITDNLLNHKVNNDKRLQH